MEIAVVKPAVQTNGNSHTSNQSTPSVSSSLSIETLALHKPVPANKSEKGNNQAQSEEKGKEELTREDLTNLTEHLNKFMSTIDADLEFEIHEGTDRMMVKFVNKSNHQVIKEFPPRELLDTLAAIQDYVGILLDKRV
ncbi:flagellar protein FlaG [Desulfitobacterium sp. THU1]|uniref:flagellar protein FlaG n=1 Tax=Desulfitobacterium sp. THU1 TaxID=3138072 RepID=UPI00311FD548